MQHFRNDNCMKGRKPLLAGLLKKYPFIGIVDVGPISFIRIVDYKLFSAPLEHTGHKPFRPHPIAIP